MFINLIIFYANSFNLLVLSWVGKLMTSRRELLETFPLALTGVKSSSENFFFYTSSLAFKFFHEVIYPLAIQVLSVATTRRILRFFIPDHDVEVEDGIESTNDTDSNERIEEIVNADEPLADEEWLKRYNEEGKQNQELQRMLQKRLDGTEHVDSW